MISDIGLIRHRLKIKVINLLKVIEGGEWKSNEYKTDLKDNQRKYLKVKNITIKFKTQWVDFQIDQIKLKKELIN